MSRFVASTTPPVGLAGSLGDKARTAVYFAWLQLQTMLGVRLPLDRFDGAEFGDFLWQTLFWSSLPPADSSVPHRPLRNLVGAMERDARDRARAVAAKIREHRHHRLRRARGPDALARHRRAADRLVVRYHDSMSVFLPHTVKQAKMHQFFHLSALQENAKSAVFACVSEHSRTKLLQLFPSVEKRAFVVHDQIADDYFPETAAHEAVTDIITSRIDAESEPAFASARERNSFYDSHVRQEDFRFILWFRPWSRARPPRPARRLGGSTNEDQASARARVRRIARVGQ